MNELMLLIPGALKGVMSGLKEHRKVLLRFIVRVREEVHLIMINIKVDITRSAAKKKKILKDIAQSIKRRVDLYSRKRRRLLDWQHILECYRTRQD